MRIMTGAAFSSGNRLVTHGEVITCQVVMTLTANLDLAFDQDTRKRATVRGMADQAFTVGKRFMGRHAGLLLFDVTGCAEGAAALFQ